MKPLSRHKFNGKIWTYVVSAPDKRYANAIIRGNTPMDARVFNGYYTKVVKNPMPTGNDEWLIYKKTRKRTKRS